MYSGTIKSDRLEGTRQINTVSVIKHTLHLHPGYPEVHTGGGSLENGKNSLCIKTSLGSSVWNWSYLFFLVSSATGRHLLDSCSNTKPKCL